MQPVKIIRAKNGYIMEVTVGNATEHYVVSRFAQVIEALENHFKDAEYMNEKMEAANKEQFELNVN